MTRWKVIKSDAVDLIKRVPDGAITTSVFSPPYDDVRDYNGDVGFDPNSLAAELLRATRDGGWCCIVINDQTKAKRKSLTTFRTAIDFVDAGWGLFETVIYSRHGRPGGWWSTRFRVDHEYILMFFKGKDHLKLNKEHLKIPSKHKGTYSGTVRTTSGDMAPVTSGVMNDMKCRGTIWHYNTSNNDSSKLKRQHPATYPDKLAEDLVLATSNPGDLVVDPYNGSGTTGVMAVRHKRRFYGGDVSKEYVALSRERIRREA